MTRSSRRYEERGYGPSQSLPNPIYIVAPERGNVIEKPDTRDQMAKVYGVRDSLGSVYDCAHKYQPKPRLRDPNSILIFHSAEKAESDLAQAKIDFPEETFHVFQFVPERSGSYSYPAI